MTDLRVDFVGMHFPNPFMLASAPPARTAEMIMRAFAAGWGGAVTKSIGLEPTRDLQPRLQPLRYRKRNIGMENVERRVLELSGYLWSRLNELGKDMLTPEGTRSPVVSFNQLGATEIAAGLMKQRIKVTGREAHGGHVSVDGELRRVGHIRVSPHFYNTKADIDGFIDALSHFT